MADTLGFVPYDELEQGVDLARRTVQQGVVTGDLDPNVGWVSGAYLNLLADAVSDEIEGGTTPRTVDDLLNGAVQDGLEISPGESIGPYHDQGMSLARNLLVLVLTPEA